MQYRSAIIGAYGAMAFVLAGLLLAGCPRSAQESPKASAYEKDYPHDNIVAAERLDLDHITTAQNIQLTLEARHAEDVDCAFPNPKDGEKLGEFTVQSSKQADPVLGPDGKIVVSKTYTLEPFLPGDYELPSLAVEYWDKSKSDAEHQHIDTDPVKITVASVLTDAQGQTDIKEITPPLSLPPSIWRWLAPVLIALALLALGGGFWAWRRRKKAAVASAPEPAHLVALRRLEALHGERLLEQGEFKLFYFRVSAILRHYLEDGCGMHAPERTTEEFLAELEAGRALADQHRSLLRSFLKHCDLVKFAEHRPTEPEAEEVFATCRHFIEEMHAAQARAASEASAGRS